MITTDCMIFHTIQDCQILTFAVNVCDTTKVACYKKRKKRFFSWKYGEEPLQSKSNMSKLHVIVHQ